MVIHFLRVVTVAQMERVCRNHSGNAQIIPFRTKTRRTVQNWPTPPQSA